MDTTDEAIGAYDYAAWDLETKLAWITGGSGVGGAQDSVGALLNLGESYARTDAILRKAGAEHGIEWQGTAAAAAGGALDTAARRSTDVGTAQRGGGTAVTRYVESYGGMSAAIGRMRPPAQTFWGDVGDHTIGIFGFRSDHAQWEEQRAQLDAEANRVLKGHEVAARDAVANFPELAPAAPVTAPAGPDPAGPDASGPDASGGGAGRSAGPRGADGGAGGPGADGPGRVGGAHGGPAGGIASTIPVRPGPDDRAGSPPPGSSTIPAGTGTAAHDPTGMPIQQPPSSVPSWSPGTTTPGTTTPGTTTPGTPGASSGLLPFSPGWSGGGWSGGGGPDGGGRHRALVSTGPEFAAQLPRAGELPRSGELPRAGEPRSVEPRSVEPGAGVSRQGPVEAAGGGRAGTPGGMDMPAMGGGGRGGGATTRRAKYRKPSADAFAVPLPPHVGGVLGSGEEVERSGPPRSA